MEIVDIRASLAVTRINNILVLTARRSVVLEAVIVSFWHRKASGVHRCTTRASHTIKTARKALLKTI